MAAFLPALFAKRVMVECSNRNRPEQPKYCYSPNALKIAQIRVRTSKLSTPRNYSDRIKGKMNPLVSKVHGKERRWSAEYAALRQLCLASGLNEELKWGQACYDLNGGNIVLIHGFKDYCALLFMKGALLKD